MILVLIDYAQLLLHISYEKSDLYMLVTSKAFLVAIGNAWEILCEAISHLFTG